METMILGIVNKELNAIVWLGALLGAVMGIIMLSVGMPLSRQEIYELSLLSPALLSYIW